MAPVLKWRVIKENCSDLNKNCHVGKWLDIQQGIFLQITDLMKQEGGCLVTPAMTLYPSKKIKTIAQNFTPQQSEE